jgi:BarA-like signal transduction histidine kinase
MDIMYVRHKLIHITKIPAIAALPRAHSDLFLLRILVVHLRQ